MRVAAFVHFAMPYRNAGSESVLHRMLKEHALSGDTVECFTTEQRQYGSGETYDHVKVTNLANPAQTAASIRHFKPDVVYTHHHNAVYAVRQAQKYGWKSVLLVHGAPATGLVDTRYIERAMRHAPDLIVYNSDWVAAHYAATQYKSKQMVVHPPLDCERHKVDRTGDKVTLVNLNGHKGGHHFYQLAQRMPDVEFLGVVGGHGRQITDRAMPNVTIHPHTSDMRAVWEQTGVVLMPSIYESYGLVGIEAGCSGIPTIAHPTPGLRESLDYAGTFVDRDDLGGWEYTIREVIENRSRYSVEARRRSIELCDLATTELAALIEEVREAC